MNTFAVLSRVPSVETLASEGWGDRAQAFHDFLSACDKSCIRRCGLSIYDLPDWCYADAFEDEQEPYDVVSDLLAEEGFDE